MFEKCYQCLPAWGATTTALSMITNSTVVFQEQGGAVIPGQVNRAFTAMDKLLTKYVYLRRFNMNGTCRIFPDTLSTFLVLCLTSQVSANLE